MFKQAASKEDLFRQSGYPQVHSNNNHKTTDQIIHLKLGKQGEASVMVP